MRYDKIAGVSTVTESLLGSYSPADAYTANLLTNSSGESTGFTITEMRDRGIWLDGALFIEYMTRITDSAEAGSTFTNTLSWSASNFPTPRSITKLVVLTTATGTASSRTPVTATIEAKKVLNGADLTSGAF